MLIVAFVPFCAFSEIGRVLGTQNACGDVLFKARHRFRVGQRRLTILHEAKYVMNEIQRK